MWRGRGDGDGECEEKVVDFGEGRGGVCVEHDVVSGAVRVRHGMPCPYGRAPKPFLATLSPNPSPHRPPPTLPVARSAALVLTAVPSGSSERYVCSPRIGLRTFLDLKCELCLRVGEKAGAYVRVLREVGKREEGKGGACNGNRWRGRGQAQMCVRCDHTSPT